MTKKEIAIRQALADYMQAEGCSCCRSTDEHREAGARLGKLLQVPKYKDGSGYDFGQFRTDMAHVAQVQPNPPKGK